MQKSAFFKRLRAEANVVDENGLSRTRQRTMSAPSPLPVASSSSFTTSLTDRPEPSSSYRDRFVTARELDDMRAEYHLSDMHPKRKRLVDSAPRDPLKDRANGLFRSLLQTEITPDTPGPNPKRRRLLSFHSSDPQKPPTDDTYMTTPVSSEARQLLFTPAKPIRSVCKAPYRVLDAPNLSNDFYLSVVDWSSANNISVALGSSVYTLRGENSAADLLCTFPRHDPVSSVSWNPDGWTLSVASTNGNIRIYDTATQKLVRGYAGAHRKRIGTMNWLGNVLTSGSRDGWIHHRDLRTPDAPFQQFMGHRDDVCGLRWSGQDATTALLASGGNDNRVCLWDLRAKGSDSLLSIQRGSTWTPQPVWKFQQHKAAVKALAWSPHVNGLLATGGGSKDKHIRFWNTISGKMLHELDTGSQICNLLWSRTSQELVSTHGHASSTTRNHISIWRYPSLELVTTLAGHTDRILYLAMSPDGAQIVSGSGDRTLRFWHAFPKSETSADAVEDSQLDYGKLIR